MFLTAKGSDIVDTLVVLLSQGAKSLFKKLYVYYKDYNQQSVL